MSSKPGSIFGGMLLIAGSCIGAGMLGIPIITGIAGFLPTLIMFFLTWAFMTATGLLLVEVNGWYPGKVNLLTMIETTIGKSYRYLSWLLYLGLFYSLLVAYLVLSGDLLSTFLLPFTGAKIPSWIGSTFFVILFGWIVYLGTKPVDISNRFLMLGKIVCYIGLVILGLGAVSSEKLLRSDINYMLIGLPLLFTSFGFHNMIPTVTTYMKGDLRRVKLTIISGSFFTLLIYLIWEIIVLGILPIQGIETTLANNEDATQALVRYLGISWISSFGQGLAFFAILTSFLAQSLGLVHFWEDGLKLKYRERENIWICLLTLAPPLIVSIFFPDLFFQALNFAGGFCAVILFGIFPACMVWKGRNRRPEAKTYQVFGGKSLLFVILIFAIFVFLYQLTSMIKG
jgi:tyrosine-specific transport protein